MAEFVEVMRQMWRMCKNTNCKDCLMNEYDDCLYIPENYSLDDIEKQIMDWAEKHPEAEQQNKIFQARCKPKMPCYFMQMSVGKCCKRICRECVEAERIPPEVAKKLGVKPEEEKNDG